MLRFTEFLKEQESVPYRTGRGIAKSIKDTVSNWKKGKENQKNDDEGEEEKKRKKKLRLNKSNISQNRHGKAASTIAPPQGHISFNTPMNVK